jgi:hypothetical protein
LCTCINKLAIQKIDKKESESDAEKTYELVWADEFDVDGLPDADKWFLETDAPENGGWYNNEKQHYTDRIDNASVSDGTLKIIAKKESYTHKGSTQEFTSARFNSKVSLHLWKSRSEG